MTIKKDNIHAKNDPDASVKKMIWQTPHIQIQKFSLKDINSGDSAINENQAGDNFLSS